MMSDQDFEAIPKLCHFEGWQFQFGTTIAEPYLRVRCKEGTCNLTGEPMHWSGRKWLLSRHMTPSEVVQTAWLAVLTALEHEAREKFTWEGVTVMQPHRDLAVLVGQAKTCQVREDAR